MELCEGTIESVWFCPIAQVPVQHVSAPLLETLALVRQIPLHLELVVLISIGRCMCVYAYVGRWVFWSSIHYRCDSTDRNPTLPLSNTRPAPPIPSHYLYISVYLSPFLCTSFAAHSNRESNSSRDR